MDNLSRRTESEVKRRLARELHDSVAQILTLMVVDMENFKLDQADLHQVVSRVDSLQESTREVLHNLRQVLYDLREEPSTESSFVHQVRTLLERTGEVEVAWDTGSPHEAWRQIAADPVDAVLVDLNLGGPVDGMEAARMLTARYPELRVVLMSGLVDEKRLVGARDAGVVGFLPKALAADELLSALQAMVLPGTSAARVPLRPVLEPGAEAPIEPLSPRETEVLAEIRLGRTNREIAQQLRVSTTTINKHVGQVLRKLRVRNRAEAAIVATAILFRPRQ